MSARQHYKIPTWLDELGKQYWRRVASSVNLTDATVDTFALLCDSYSRYRQAEDLRGRKIAFDHYYKLATQFRLTPKAAGAAAAKPEAKDALDEFLAKPRIGFGGTVERRDDSA